MLKWDSQEQLLWISKVRVELVLFDLRSAAIIALLQDAQVAVLRSTVSCLHSEKIRKLQGWHDNACVFWLKLATCKLNIKTYWWFWLKDYDPKSQSLKPLVPPSVFEPSCSGFFSFLKLLTGHLHLVVPHLGLDKSPFAMFSSTFRYKKKGLPKVSMDPYISWGKTGRIRWLEMFWTSSLIILGSFRHGFSSASYRPTIFQLVMELGLQAVSSASLSWSKSCWYSSLERVFFPARNGWSLI